MAAKKPAKKPQSEKVKKTVKPAAKALPPARAPKKATAKKRATQKAAAPAKKSSAKRTVPKISPLKGMSVDAWTDAVTGWQGDAIRLIRAIVARHAPLASASIKWGQPVWEQNGPFAWIRPASKHVSFGFWRGAEMTDPGGHLEGEGGRMRHVKVRSAAHVGELEKPIRSFVEQAVALNVSKGDPTKGR